MSNEQPLLSPSAAEKPERKMSAFFSGRKRSSGGTTAPHHVKFKIGGANIDDLTVVHEGPTVLHVNELHEEPSQNDKLLGEKERVDKKLVNESSLDSTNSSSSIFEYTSISRNNSFIPPYANNRNVFVELYDLNLDDEKALNGYWDETARWVKYEEDAEGIDHRWGQPHVAFLTTKSIFQLRKCLNKGIVILDSKVVSFPELCEQIAKSMVTQGHCVLDTQRIMDILMLKHNHVVDRRISHISRISSAFFDKPSDENRPKRTCSAAPLHHNRSGAELQFQIAQLSACPTSPSNLLPCGNDDFVDDINCKPYHPLLEVDPQSKHSTERKISNFEESERIHKRSISSFVFNKFRRNFSKPANLDEDDLVLPFGTETAQVFCGAINELKKVRLVMVRLENAIMMPEVVERQIPVRFVFVVLGPQNPGICYHELGRAICTMIANKEFNSLAYTAKSTEELLGAIDCFLNGSVLIPPGEVDSKRLLSGDEIKKALKLCMPPEMNETHEDVNANRIQNGASNHVDIGSKDNGHKPKNFRYFGGMIDDLKNRYPQYKSDITDAFKLQCLTSVTFMFFAAFAPAITFGGLLGKYTEERMGVIETLFAQCFCGIIWGLFSAQPLLIMSATGPVLIFEASLYTTCKTLGLDFMEIRLYAGFWILLIAILITAVDGSRLLRFVTRFTEDIFATLISVIFIAESLHFAYHTFVENPVENFNYYEKAHSNCGNSSGVLLPNLTFAPTRTFPNITKILKQEMSLVAKRGIASSDGENKTLDQATAALSNILNNSDIDRALMASFKQNATKRSEVEQIPCLLAEPNTALLTAIIMLSTFSLAFLLKKLRESFYLGRHLRNLVGDFGVLISIVVVGLVVQFFFSDSYLQRLEMPAHLTFTNSEARGHGLLILPYFVSLARNSFALAIALIAALLVFILLFVETEITELLLLRKEKGCRKGGGMNFDLILLAICSLFCSIFGLPWMCAAVLQSLSHCSSLTVFKKKAPGAKLEVDYVIEQRVTTICISLLIGLIAFAGSYLRLLPVAILFGIFFYLGIMNLSGVQFIERVILFIVPEKYFPARPFTNNVSFWRLNFYTFIQIALLVFIYIVKHYKQTALAFPFVLMVFIAFRQLILPLIFSDKELKALDGEDEEEEENWTEKDLYHVPLPV